MHRRSIIRPLITSIFVSVCLMGSLQARASSLPEGAGKEALEGICLTCHNATQITRSSGYTEQEWQSLTETMIDLSDAPEQKAEIIGYLTTHFPPNTKRAPTLVAGPHKINFQEWITPTLGQRSRDPIEARDGTIWWAGQFGNLIGKITPSTGEMKEYPLPAGAYPHSVTLDQNGNVWYTGNKNGTVGKLDIKTKKITAYPMPDAQAKDPHTAIFDRNGIMWFTLQHSNMIGRLNPKDGTIKLVTVPTPNARPYGIKIDAAGSPWVSCNGSNCLIKVDPETMALKMIELPIPATTVRRLDIADDGMIWYVNSSQGRLGRYDPKTSYIKEWPSPSGPKSHPYAIAVIDGIVWYNESGKRPDALVRFEPKNETFQSWAIPSGNVFAGIVRHMRASNDGNLLIHQSSTNRIIKVTIK